MVVTTRFLTAQDLMAMAESLGPGRHELIEGELVSMSPAYADHGEVSTEFAFHLRSQAGRGQRGMVFIGETGFYLRRDPDTVRVPDVAYVRADRLPPRAERRGYMPVVPDIAVEVLSSSERRAAIANKVAMYLKAGVRLIWLADPRDRTVTVHAPGVAPRVLGPDDWLDGGDMLPGFRVRVGDFFPLDEG